MDTPGYRGRIAPSPTGYLHIGHARTFWQAAERARAAGGELILRNEDIDEARCKSEFVAAMLEDLRWLGLRWNEGPDVGGPHAPYNQSERRQQYLLLLEQLKSDGFAYPCYCSRQDVARAASAPHPADEELIYPGTCRPRRTQEEHARLAASDSPERDAVIPPRHTHDDQQRRISWRFRVPDGETISFLDQNLGQQSFVAGQDFGDFVLWRPDNYPSYQLAVVADDAAMRITEVVRGADLLISTCRQILLYRALHLPVPKFYHCRLVTDENGVRLAKRHASLSLRALRESGMPPQAVLSDFHTASGLHMKRPQQK